MNAETNKLYDRSKNFGEKRLSACFIMESASSLSEVVGCGWRGRSGVFHPQTLMYNPHPLQVTQKLCSVIPITFLAVTTGIWTLGQVVYGPCVKLLGRVYELQGWKQPKSSRRCKLDSDKK